MVTGMSIKDEVLTVIFAMLVGIVILNAVKEDPTGEDRRRRLWVFALSACTYAAILLMTR
jgi:hypothetical protein